MVLCVVKKTHAVFTFIRYCDFDDDIIHVIYQRQSRAFSES